MSLTNFIIRGDMRDYYRKRLEAGHRAGKEFLQRNKGADRAWLGGFLEVGLGQVLMLRIMNLRMAVLSGLSIERRTCASPPEDQNTQLWISPGQVSAGACCRAKPVWTKMKSVRLLTARLCGARSLQEIDSSVERFTLPEALQDTNEKLGENVHNIVRPLTDPTVRRLPRQLPPGPS